MAEKSNPKRDAFVRDLISKMSLEESRAAPHFHPAGNHGDPEQHRADHQAALRRSLPGALHP